MPDQTAAIALVHALLIIASYGYAVFLNRDAVQAWYRPDHVEVTVMGGVALIGVAIVALWLLGVFGAIVPILYVTLNLAAGLPITAWQREKRLQRQKNQDEIKQREQERQQ